MKVTALMPVKKDSERLLNKNRKLFAGRPLFRIVLEALLQAQSVDDIVVNTDCEEIGQAIKKDYPAVQLIERPPHLLGHNIMMNALIENDISFCRHDHILQTHCTNPLLTAATIDRAVGDYFAGLPAYDSLFSVNKIQSRLYDALGKPLNHRPAEMERTQDMQPVYQENSHLFIFSKAGFAKCQNRVGVAPQLFEMDPLESVDIDYEADFRLAELIYLHRDTLRG